MKNNVYRSSPLGIASGDFLTNGYKVLDTSLLDLINNIQMYYGGADCSVTSPLCPVGISKGTVTLEDIYSVYPFTNYMYTVTVTGSQLRTYLEFSVCKYFKTYMVGDSQIYTNNGVQDYNYDILQGANYTVDLTKSGLFDSTGDPLPTGEPRITKLTYKGSEVKNSQVLKLALNSYRFSGGGGILKAANIKPQSLDPKAINYVTFDSQKTFGETGQIRNLIAKYFQDMAAGKIIPGKTEVEPTCDYNWHTIPQFLDIVCITDLHGAIDHYPKPDAPKKNAAILSGAVLYERATFGDERTILLSCGDMMQGTALSNILKGKPVIDIMNQMAFDAMEIGNHELDWGLESLHENTGNAKFPFLVANMSLNPGDTDPEASQFLNDCKPWCIINKGGLKIGLIGVAHPNTAYSSPPSVMGHFLVKDPAETVNALVPVVKSAGANIIVVISHIGDQYTLYPDSGTQPDKVPLTEDLARLVQKISGVTAIFGGNSHTINYDMVPDATGKLIPAVIGYSDGKGLGLIRFALDNNFQILNAVPGYLDIYFRLYSAITPDPKVQAIVDATKQVVEPILQEVIGKTDVDLTSETAPIGNLDSNLGNWAADVIRSTGNASFGFMHTGGLRTDLLKGDITVGNLWTLMPFDNEVSVMDMTGEQVKELLEYMVSGIEDRGHVSGLRYTYDPLQPARFELTASGALKKNPSNTRIRWITMPDGTPLEMAKTYKVAAPDFIAAGGDHYPFPSLASFVVSTHVLIRDAMLRDIKERSSLHLLPEGRIQYFTYSWYQFIKPIIYEVMANQEITKDFGIKTVYLGNSGYWQARVKVTLKGPANSKAEMLYYDSFNKKYVDAAALGYWGPEKGFYLMPDYTKTDTFQLKFPKAGEYTLQLALIDLSTNKEIMNDSIVLTVLDPSPSITTTLGTTGFKDEKRDFTATLVANNGFGKEVKIRITTKNPKSKAFTLKYIDMVGKEHDVKFDAKTGEAWFGPKKDDEGFPLNNMTILFNMKLEKPEVCKLVFEIVQLSNNEVLASQTETIEIIEKKKK